MSISAVLEKPRVQPQITIEGISLNIGIAHGYAYMYNPEFDDDINLSTADKKQRYLEAVEKAVDLCAKSKTPKKENTHQLVLVQKTLLQDPSWQARVIEKIENNLSITEALEMVLRDLDLAFGSDRFWHARFQEVKGITQLVRQCLSKFEIEYDPKKPIVLCAKTISPVEMMQFESANLVALVVEDNSFLSHGMIIARSKRIPVVGGVIQLKKFINTGDELLLDGDLGRIYVRPLRSIVANYDTSKRPQFSKPSAVSNKGCVTSRDGTPVYLHVNANIRASCKKDLEKVLCRVN